MRVILLLCLILSGCATTSKPDAILPPKEQTVHIDLRALELCQPLLKLEKDSELLEITIKNFELYAECAEKQKNSVILLKKFGGL